MGDGGCFSFYSRKNFGAYGEGGANITNNTKLNEKIRMLCDQGQLKKYYHAMIGCDARKDGFQCVILNMKLKHLPLWNEARRKNALLYNQLLNEVDGIVIHEEAEYAKYVYHDHVYAIRTHNCDKLIKFLAEKDIYYGIHYSIPIHLQ